MLAQNENRMYNYAISKEPVKNHGNRVEEKRFCDKIETNGF